MKINIINNLQNSIEGFKNVFLNDLQEIPNNSCFDVYLHEHCLKNIRNEDFNREFKRIASKLRHNGTIYIKCPDIKYISMMFNRGSIDEKSLSNLIGNSQGFYNHKIIESALINNNIKIKQAYINNYHFVIRGFRE